MIDILIDKLKNIFSSRLLPVGFAFIFLLSLLVIQLFKLQIVQVDDYQQDVSVKYQKTREIKSTRGNFYDRKGVLLAYNELTYSVVLEDSSELQTNDEKNRMLYNLILLLEKHGNLIENEFGLSLDEDNLVYFNVEGNAELRFKKEVYGKRYVDDLSKEEREATALEVFDYLRYGKSKYQPMFNISDEYDMHRTLQIMTLRYALYINYPKYNQIIIATDVSDRTVASIRENSAYLPGVEIKLQTYRIYNESFYTAHMLGYTGLVNANELENLNKDEVIYNSSDVIGKTGLEKAYETYLAGSKGIETISVNKSNKYIDTIERVDPVAGNDVYLTIDIELQKAYYHIIERNLAGILLSKINNSTDAGTRGTSASDIRIPIYDVYYALINNNVINTNHFSGDDATELEKSVYDKFKQKESDVFLKLDELLEKNNTKSSTAITSEMAEYLEYIYDTLLKNKILIGSDINKTDSNYLSYQNNKLSLSQFLQYSIANNWVDLTKLYTGNDYFSTEEWYDKLVAYIKDMLIDDSTFHKKLYRDLVYSYKLTGTEICLLLYDQSVLEYNEEEISRLKNKTISAYTFITDKIRDLSITPAQLALDPCSASVVVTDIKTGEIIAMVTYPSYDNNKFANKIDSAYFAKLNSDLTGPMYHKAAKQRTAPGSTFKMVSAIAGLEEGVIGTTETIRDLTVFDKITQQPPKCWSYHSHGHVDVTGALEVSCNFFFYEVGWRLSSMGSNSYRDQTGLDKLSEYASMLGLYSKSGIEIEEAEPAISTRDAVRSSIGQGTNDFTPVQLARYVTTLANGGTLFDLTLIDAIKDKDGNVILDNQATYKKLDEIKPSSFRLVQEGMYKVGNGSRSSSSSTFKDLPFDIAGKTGTAQVSLSKANHGLFVSYAPAKEPEISITTVIPNGYSSTSAVNLTKDLYSYFYNVEDREALVNGNAITHQLGSSFSD